MEHILVRPSEINIESQMSELNGFPHLAGGVLVPSFIDSQYLESRLLLKNVSNISEAIKSLGLKKSGNSYVGTQISDPESEYSVPELVDVESELENWINDAFSPYGLKIMKWDFTMRVLEPNGSTVKRHQDYKIGWNTKLNPARTCIGISIPISGDIAPPFIAEITGQNLNQTEPGSCMIFGPQVWHAHPPIEGFDGLYFWLVLQAFLCMKE